MREQTGDGKRKVEREHGTPMKQDLGALNKTPSRC